jgi:hypothetical protein
MTSRAELTKRIAALPDELLPEIAALRAFDQ